MTEPLDPSFEYLVPGELDTADILALRHRLTNLRALAQIAELNKVDNPEPSEESGTEDIVFHTLKYQTIDPCSGIEETLYVQIHRPCEIDYPVLTIRIADLPGQRAISLSEPILTDRSNYITPESTNEHLTAVVDRWLDLTSRPIFNKPTGLWGQVAGGQSNPLIKPARATEDKLRELVSVLIHASKDELYNLLAPQMQFIFGGRYRLPALEMNFNPYADEQHTYQVLTHEAAVAFGELFPGLVEIAMELTSSGISYSFAPWLSSAFTAAPPASLIDQMKAIATLPDGVCLNPCPIKRSA